MRKALINLPISPETKGHAEPLSVKICDTFSTRLKGYMFQDSISLNEGLLFANKSKNILDAIIHMFFMNFDLAVFWLDEKNIVVDKTIAKRWHPYYAPKTAAQKILEVHPAQIEKFSIGDQLTIEIS